jgi:hypothetical protein
MLIVPSVFPLESMSKAGVPLEERRTSGHDGDMGATAVSYFPSQSGSEPKECLLLRKYTLCGLMSGDIYSRPREGESTSSIRSCVSEGLL